MLLCTVNINYLDRLKETYGQIPVPETQCIEQCMHDMSRASSYNTLYNTATDPCLATQYVTKGLLNFHCQH